MFRISASLWLDFKTTLTTCRYMSRCTRLDTQDLGNYRPISLLNSLYKIFASIIQNRIASVLDFSLTTTQFGFRKSRGTSDAMHLIRRVIDRGAATNKKTLLLLLDWEKAFDRITHSSMFTALKRAGLPDKYINIIAALYRNPKFYIEADGFVSDFFRQNTGIRQGCPLSPYLFIVVMSVLMQDVDISVSFSD